MNRCITHHDVYMPDDTTPFVAGRWAWVECGPWCSKHGQPEPYDFD